MAFIGSSLSEVFGRELVNQWALYVTLVDDGVGQDRKIGRVWARAWRDYPMVDKTLMDPFGQLSRQGKAGRRFLRAASSGNHCHSATSAVRDCQRQFRWNVWKGQDDPLFGERGEDARRDRGDGLCRVPMMALSTTALIQGPKPVGTQEAHKQTT